MKQKKATKILKTLAIVLLCFPFALRAATNDDFIQGYASAVLGREFRVKNFSLDVAGETVRIRSADIAAADHDKVMAALSSIQGVKQVTIVDPQGFIVASSPLDIQNWEENKWSTAFSVRGGLQFERPQSFMRKISLLLEYYKGHSPNGQFFNEKIEYFGPGLHLDF